MNTQTSAARLPKRLSHRVFRTGSRFEQARFGLLAGLGLAALLLISAPAQAATAPDLGSTEPYAIVSGTFSNTTAGTTIDGDVCYTTPPATAPFISGATVVPCPDVTGTDQNAARADLISQDCMSLGAAVELNATSIGAGSPGVFPPGCYSSTGAMNITAGTTVTLSGAGVYIFRPGGAITAGANSNVVVEGGTCEYDVFWAPEGATTIGANANFFGNIFRGVADGLSITFGDSSSLIGRALAFGSTVTTDNTTIVAPDDCPAEPGDAEGGRTTFLVNKIFDDNNPAEVEVTLSCNTGLPLEQTTTISEGDPVDFVIVDFEDGTLDCEVTEVVPDGYTASYNNGTGLSPDSCVFEDIDGATSPSHICVITNSLNEVEVEVTKVWIDENPQFNPSNIADAEWECSNVAFGNDAGLLDFFGNPDTDSFFVFPDWDGGTNCAVTEVNVPDGGVEIDDSDCDSIIVTPGSGGSCTIFNTRLFEGIPTLSQYGLAVLALLMLGVGLVGFRRFA